LWRPLYTGQRKGEILGLYKSNVNWSDETIVFNHSYDEDSNKSDKENIVPIAPELRPYLERAFRRDRDSALVFPHPSGRMYTKEFDLAAMIRRGAARAGLVKGSHERELSPEAPGVPPARPEHPRPCGPGDDPAHLRPP
jgi:integrase